MFEKKQCLSKRLPKPKGQSPWPWMRSKDVMILFMYVYNLFAQIHKISMDESKNNKNFRQREGSSEDDPASESNLELEITVYSKESRLLRKNGESTKESIDPKQNEQSNRSSRSSIKFSPAKKNKLLNDEYDEHLNKSSQKTVLSLEDNDKEPREDAVHHEESEELNSGSERDSIQVLRDQNVRKSFSKIPQSTKEDSYDLLQQQLLSEQQPRKENIKSTFTLQRNGSKGESLLREKQIEFIVPNNGSINQSTNDVTESNERGIFPFKTSPSGTLKIFKNMIAFENGQIAVLVNDGTRVNVKQEIDNHSGLSKISLSMGPKDRDEEMSPQNGVNYDNPSFNGSPTSKREIESFKSELKEYQKPHQNFPDSLDLIENFHHRLRRAIHPDTTIVIGNKEFPCHGIALQAYSQYFDSMRRPSDTIHRIHIPEEIIKSQEFPSLMDWILLDEAVKPLVIKKSNVIQLYAAAQYLCITGLKEQCKHFIDEKLTTGDPMIIEMYQEARKRPNCKDVKRCLASKLAHVFPFMYKSKQFLCLGLEELVMLINSDDVMIESELEIYEVAARWLLHDWSNRHCHAIRVMRCVRFGLLKPIELTQIQHYSDASNQPMPDYRRIYSFAEVKDMLQDGLSYAIFRENYNNHPEEFNKWMDWSKVQCPRPRHNIKANSTSVNRMTAKVSLKEKLSDNVDDREPEKEQSFPHWTQRMGQSQNGVNENSPPHSPSQVDPQPSSPKLKSQDKSRRRSSLLDNPFTMASILRRKNSR